MAKYLFQIEVGTTDFDADQLVWELATDLKKIVDRSGLQQNYMILHKDGQQYPSSAKEMQLRKESQNRQQRDDAIRKYNDARLALDKATKELLDIPILL